MEINSNMNASGVKGPTPAKRVATASKLATDDVSLAGSAALEKSLQETPDSRPEAVEKARQLINDVQYPPQETIKKISHLLAIKLKSDSE
jgi:hypothetical protein